MKLEENLTDRVAFKAKPSQREKLMQTAKRFGTDSSDIARRALDIGLKQFAKATPLPGSPTDNDED